MLSRVFPQDVGACELCGGHMRFVACIDDPPIIKKILTHRGLPTVLPQKAPARDPPQLELRDWEMSSEDDATYDLN